LLALTITLSKAVAMWQKDGGWMVMMMISDNPNIHRQPLPST